MAITLNGSGSIDGYTGLVFNEVGADSNIRIETSGRPNAFFLDGGTGNIGMGTDTPGRELHIVASGAQIKLESDNTGSWSGMEYSAGNGTYNAYTGILDNNGSFFIDVASNGDDLVITQSGLVGIKKTNPSYTLDVYGTTRIDNPNSGLALRVSRDMTGTVTTSSQIVDAAAVYINGDENGGSDALRIGAMYDAGNYFIDVSNYNGTASYDLLLQPFVGNVGIGTTNAEVKLQINDANTTSVGNTAGNYIENLRIYGNNGNVGSISQYTVRTADGNDWYQSGSRFQMKIDETYMGYIQFNGTGVDGGVSFGTGLSTSGPTGVTEKVRIDQTGNTDFRLSNGNVNTMFRDGTLGLNGTTNHTDYGSLRNVGNFRFQDGQNFAARYLHMKTNRHVTQTQMYSVTFRGHSHGESKPINANLVWYNYIGANNVVTVGSWGSHSCSCYKSSDGYAVMTIYISDWYFVAMTIDQFYTNQGLTSLGIVGTTISSSATGVY